MNKRLFWCLPFLAFLLIRQIYANLLGINRDVLSSALLVILSGASIYGLLRRLSERRSDFLPIDILTFGQIFLAAPAIWLYFLFGKILAADVVFAAFYYCFVPLLIYSGFFLVRWKEETIRALLFSSVLVFALTCVIAVTETAGLNLPLFANDRRILQITETGLARASGLYGTQIDYGFLCFAFFSGAAYVYKARPRKWLIILMMVALLGLCLSISRVFIAATFIVFFYEFILRGSRTSRVGSLVSIIVIAGVSFPFVRDSGMLGVLTSQDSLAAASNENRLLYFQQAATWLFRDYPVVGLGPATQIGPDPQGLKFIGDFLWLSYPVEFGTLAGTLILLMKLATLVLIFFRSLRLTPDPLAKIVLTLTLVFLLVSFVDSAYAHLITISGYYLLAGVLLHRQPRSIEMAQEPGPRTSWLGEETRA